MARSLNRATLIGNLGQDPELKTTPQGSSVCTISIATSEKYKDKNGEWQESTDWHRVVLWDKLADIAKEYLRKGSKVFIEGRIKTRSYEKDNETKYITEIVGNHLIMLSPKEQSDVEHESSPSPENHLATDSVTAEEDEVPF